MFSNTAYEALYQYLGLSIHGQFIEAITSEVFFKAMVLIIFGGIFFVTAIKFFSRYMPSALVTRKHIPLSSFAKIIFCLFLGLALLRVGSTTSVKNYDGRTWASNSYIKSKYGDIKDNIKVSFIFDLLSRTAEETSAFLGKVIDKAMSNNHSQLGAPDFFYKAIMYSASATINDQSLKESLHFYTQNCFDKVLSEAASLEDNGVINDFFLKTSRLDSLLYKIKIKDQFGSNLNCSDVKDEVREGLEKYAFNHHQTFLALGENIKYPIKMQAAQNMDMANMLVNFYLDNKEAAFGIMKGSQPRGAMGRVFQYLNRLLSFDALLSLVGFSETHGSSEAVVRAQNFSEHLARAPHVAGMIKLVLIAVFPFLIFFVVGGNWKVLVFWFVTYFSVLLWTPLWVLLYHIMLGISLSTEVMAEFGKFSDGVSLYGAKLISSRMYYFYSIYSWAQLLIATLTTGSAVFFLRPMLMENSSEKAPEFLADGAESTSKASTAIKAVGAVL